MVCVCCSCPTCCYTSQRLCCHTPACPPPCNARTHAPLRTTSLPQVRECLRSFLDQREELQLLAEYEEAGNTAPSKSSEKRQLMQQLRQQKHARELGVLLRAKRDRANCPIRPHLALLGRNARCPNTELAYKDCCGARRAPKPRVKVAAQPAAS